MTEGDAETVTDWARLDESAQSKPDPAMRQTVKILMITPC
jgi:hypothetical protein